MVLRITLVCSSLLLAIFAFASCDSGDGVNPAPHVATVQILAINDFHGNLEPPTGSSGLVVASGSDPIGATDAGARMTEAGTLTVPAGGAAYLAAQIKQLKSTNPNTMVVSAGDLTGASPLLSNLFKDEPTILAMNKIGLDVEGVGNHDFDRGLAELTRLQSGGCSLGDCDSGAMFAGATFKYLAANVDNVNQMTVFPPYVVKDFGNGVLVGVIGMTLQATPTVTVASAIQGLTFQNEVDTVNQLVPQLKQKGVSAIIVVLHQGDFQDSTGTYDSCSGLAGDLGPILNGDDAGHPPLSDAVDVLITAHTHQAYNCTINGRLVTSAASFGRLVTKIDLTLDVAAKKVTAKKAHNVPVTHDIAPDPDVAGIVAMYQTQAAPLANRVIGWITGDISASVKGSPSCETPLGDLIADAQLAATKSVGAQVAFMNPGGIRTDLVFHSPPKVDGNVLYAEAFSVQPFSNLLVTMALTGAQIKTALDQQFAGASPKILQVSSNFKYSYTYDKPSNKGVVDPMSITIDGTPLDLGTTYMVTVNNFLAGGGDAFAALAQGTMRTTGSIDLDALVAYLGANSAATTPLSPPALNRINGNGCQ
jgi:5'-nucleotidase